MRYSNQFSVQAPLVEVVAFHRLASSLKAITPPLFFMSDVEAPEQLVEGDELAFTLWFGPFPVRWEVRIEHSNERGFDDVQVHGPFASWRHAHRFESLPGGDTLMRDDISYTIRRHPIWGPIGLAMALGLPMLFWYRYRRTRRLLQDSAPQSPNQP